MDMIGHLMLDTLQGLYPMPIASCGLLSTCGFAGLMLATCLHQG